MNSQKRRLVLLVASFMPVLITGCTAARMAMSPQLVSVATEMKVEGRKNFSFDETFSFGPYQVAEVRRGWTRSTSISLSMLGKHKKKFSTGEATQKYEFVLKHGEGGVWKCQSVTGVDQHHADFLWGGKSRSGISVTSNNSFVCTFKSNNRPDVWRLTMNENFESGGVMKGILTDGNVSIVIQGTRNLSRIPLPLSIHTGYEFLMKEQVVGSVEVINKGAVWLVPSLDERLHAPLAVTSAALLLYQDIGRK